jgi:hypothetical protein
MGRSSYAHSIIPESILNNWGKIKKNLRNRGKICTGFSQIQVIGINANHISHEVDIIVMKENSIAVKLKCKIYELTKVSRIRGSHGSEYEDGCLLGCSAV